LAVFPLYPKLNHPLALSIMDINDKNSELKTKLDCVIDKSNAQTKLLKKILLQLNKQSEEQKDNYEIKKKL
jgi:Zn-finger protein